MAFSFIGSNNAAATGATEVDLSVPAGVGAGQIIVGVYAFEGVAAGSGPWIVPNNGQLAADFIGPSKGWQQVCFQAPNATGVGIEVWAAIYTSGTHQYAEFTTSQNAVAVCGAWSGEYNPNGQITGAPPRVSATAQVVGNQPAAPNVTANNGELVIACGGDLMTASKFGTPSGFTNRVDVARSGAGTVEATIADMATSAAGAVGPITFPNNAAASTTAGSTATLVIRPVPTVAGTGGVINAGLPENLDLQASYTLRIVGLDPTTGAQVSGVNIDQSVLTATQISGTPAELETGGWLLVPGPNA